MKMINANTMGALFADFYQFKMAYAYWLANKHNEIAVFDVYFRKNPFDGGFTIFTGLTDVLNFLNNFKITENDISYLKLVMSPDITDEFYNYLSSVDLSNVKVYSCDEGSVVHPHTPILTLEGPLLVVQLLETAILNLTNYSSLITTNAAHMRLLVGEKCGLAEYGCRRAQGPNGAMTASTKAYIGGFDRTSNCLTGSVSGIPLSGTVSHSFVSSFSNINIEMQETFKLKCCNNPEKTVDLYELSKTKLEYLSNDLKIDTSGCIGSELMAFVGFACAYPKEFLIVIDTYNVIKSGLPNFCAVALALSECGYKAHGIRIDSGDLVFFSNYARSLFSYISNRLKIDWFYNITIVASNDINFKALKFFKQQDHQINALGIGNNLVTCQDQTSLGLVYKLVQISSEPTIKLTEDVEKISIPYKKNLYRLYNKDYMPVGDLLTLHDEEAPEAKVKVLCRHPFKDLKKVFITPTKVEPLLHLYFANGELVKSTPDIHTLKQNVKENLKIFKADHIKLENPEPYKVSLSTKLYDNFQNLLQTVVPISEIS